MNTQEFLEALHGKSDGYFTVCTPQGTGLKARAFSTKDIGKAADYALSLVDSDVWVSVGTQTTRPGRGKRGRENEVTGIPALWADIDIGAVGHSTTKVLPPTVEAGLSLVRWSPDPDIIVSTGGGVHAYWLFEQPWEFEAGDPGPKKMTAAWHKRIAARASAHGWHVDNVSNLDRILRVPGTYNHKTDTPRLVEVIDVSS